MARPGLEKNIKFRRLVRMLGEPVPHVRGYLDCLWDVAYENGRDEIGDRGDVAIACQYPGDSETIFNALLNCGKPGAGFIDEIDGKYYVHDLFDHAPRYVKLRRERELERTVAHGVRTVAHSVRTPAPAPAPAPAPNKKKKRSAAIAASILKNPPKGFVEFWREYQRKVAKLEALQAWMQLDPDAGTQARIIAVLKAMPRLTPADLAYQKHPASWLRGRRWEDETSAGDGTPRTAVLTQDDIAHGSYTPHGESGFAYDTKVCANPKCQRLKCVAAREGA